MKLIKVEAQGFKSFADKVVLNFDGGVVGIVGPNGSGKSNINDAIRWVLGEQSSKALRGNSMEDVIFAGSKTVKELDKAEVILTFDNSDHAVSVPHDVFTISRVLYRGKGGNEYYINGEIARFRDIKEIAMESGISKSSLAIISQGTISDIAEASPEQRRGIIEEAAGTSKYKARKIEALRKLETTEEALDKVRTIISELEKRLVPLRKQAEKAKIFIEKSNELKSVEIGLLVEDLKFFSDKMTFLNNELSSVNEKKDELEAKLSLYSASIKENSNSKLKLELDADKLQSDLSKIEESLHQLELRQTRINQRRQDILNGDIKVTPEEKIETLKQELSENFARINHYKAYEEKAEAEIAKAKELSLNLDKELFSLASTKTTVSNRLETYKTKLQVLQDHKNNKTNLYKGTKTIVEHSSLFKGYKGTVADLIQVEKEFAKAIESILASALQHIVVDTSETAVKAVNFLKENRGGWATFIPLTSIQPKDMRQDHLMALQGQKGFVALASELVDTKEEFSVLKRFLLGNIVVTQTIEDANRISKLLQLKYMVVSLDGDIVRVGGVMSGGAKEDNQNNLLEIDRNISEFEKAIPKLMEEKSQLELKEVELKNKKQESISTINEWSMELSNTKSKRLDLTDRNDALKVQYDAVSSQALEFSKTDEITDEISKLTEKRNEISANLRIKRTRISSLASEIAPFVSQKTEVENSLYELSKNHSQFINEKNKVEFILQENQKRLTEHYQMTLEMAQSYQKLEIDLEEARVIVKNLKQDIKALGNVNLDSIQECEEVEERYNKLKENENELSEAKNTILDAIAEMDKIIVNKIQETVDIVNKEFRYVFQTMFGGGDAQIQYTDPQNILETGIDIIAQPPGKSVKNLKLFSGGEKAIIAISLLFAIIKAKPIPLCILDEVEAALDEANVIRYAEFLQSLKDKTQFIVITHRHGTMTKVDHLFGATMQKRGVTSFFSVELAKAKELVVEENN
ncbi:AAA family ATPase [Mesomycoplasma lagogenitalium]|uniref:Chromosome partition protein Smc n=1 Tax=Mesomycoplasma lagogenitalium TaxID=171286 RepID=A0ABY8LSW4_9BACT|nr:AAA family ATPase [Mesomycoplasma lagogenitalium]WGI36349.1 AAA family ATPase [Mesomycoplasma lagogenitalium]